MEFELLGWPDDDPVLDLDWQSFSYAGNFAVSRTGKAVVRSDGTVVAALSFDPDRTDESTLRFRYVTVRADRHGEGIGPRLLAFGLQQARKRGFRRVRIAVNNPFAYEACHRAGFGYTGRSTGVAELLLEWPRTGNGAGYEDGLAAFEDRDLPEEMSEFVDAKRSAGPPPVLSPDEWGRD